VGTPDRKPDWGLLGMGISKSFDSAVLVVWSRYFKNSFFFSLFVLLISACTSSNTADIDEPFGDDGRRSLVIIGLKKIESGLGTENWEQVWRRINPNTGKLVGSHDEARDGESGFYLNATCAARWLIDGDCDYSKIRHRVVTVEPGLYVLGSEITRTRMYGYPRDTVYVHTSHYAPKEPEVPVLPELPAFLVGPGEAVYLGDVQFNVRGTGRGRASFDLKVTRANNDVISDLLDGDQVLVGQLRYRPLSTMFDVWLSQLN